MSLSASQSDSASQQSTADAAIKSGESDVAGIVTSANGAEAGVWVIAETTDLPTKFAKIVVTDERGRYLIPDLPKAKYSVWVRGYGLIDSPKVSATPGQVLNLKAVVALTPAAAAQYYPAAYWYSMLKIPEAAEFDGKAVGKREDAARMAQRREDERLRDVPPDGQPGDAHDAQGLRAHQAVAGRVVPAHPVRSGDEQHGEQHRPRSSRSTRSRSSPTGPIASPPARFPRISRRGRKASSATSC